MNSLVVEKRRINNLRYLFLINNHNAIMNFACKKAELISKHPAGYGCYNPKVLNENGKKYIQWERWNYCD